MRAENSTQNYINILRGHVLADQFVSAALLLAETKEECTARNIPNDSEEKIYETMLMMADRLSIRNPFREKTQFYKVFQTWCNFDAAPDWETLATDSLRMLRYTSASAALLNEYKCRFKNDIGSVLVTEGEKFIPILVELVEDHPSCHFTVTSERIDNLHLLKRIFSKHSNVEVLETSIYRYGFSNNRYDLIFSIPNFGVRNLAEDGNFISREQDTVAFENLLLHTVNGGRLIITMPARTTFAQGKVGELRRFVHQSYNIKEISELPEGTFEGTGIKTFLFDVANALPGDDDITIRRYTAPKRKNRRDVISELTIEEETFVMGSELDELGDWNINKIFSQQDEEWQRFQSSSTRRAALGEVAEIFRGKSVTKKDPNGGISVVNIANIRDFDIDYDGLDHLVEEERKVTNYLLKDGDVLIPARGTAIRTAVFQEQKTPCIASSNVIVIRPDSKLLNCTYLKIFLDSPLGKKLVSGTQQGATIISISYKDLAGLEIPVPPMDTQIQTAAEYLSELETYQETISAAELRWKETLTRLESF